MFIEPCDPNTPERVAAVAAIHAYLGSIVQRAFPEADPDAMATAVWGFVHGLAFLHPKLLQTGFAPPCARCSRLSVRLAPIETQGVLLRTLIWTGPGRGLSEREPRVAPTPFDTRRKDG